MTLLKRYVPAFILATITSLIGGMLAHYFFGNILITAFAATWGENIGYYGKLFFDDIKERKIRDSKITFIGTLKVLRNMIIEFGPGEIIDSFIVRPVIIYFTLEKIESTMLGIYIGKVISDFFFYLPTIYMYKFRKKHFDD